MTTSEFLSAIKSRGASIATPASTGVISLANTNLQNMRAAMLPKFMIELYGATAAINLGAGYIFGPTAIGAGRTYPIPSIVEINQNLTNLPQLRGQTIFGRNDLFWFSFDCFGTCYMLDNLTLRILRKYDDPYRAITDCLVAGKI